MVAGDTTVGLPRTGVSVMAAIGQEQSSRGPLLATASGWLQTVTEKPLNDCREKDQRVKSIANASFGLNTHYYQ